MLRILLTNSENSLCARNDILLTKGLASYCLAKTTFTFHFSISTLSNAFLSINDIGMKSESDFSSAMASQPLRKFTRRCKSTQLGVKIHHKVYIDT